jgi:hypothetical protein
LQDVDCGYRHPVFVISIRIRVGIRLRVRIGLGIGLELGLDRIGTEEVDLLDGESYLIRRRLFSMIC